jgi:chlorobactene lauroyltransferase
MIKTQKNKIFGKLFTLYHNRLLKKHFYKIWLHGSEHLKKINESFPNILFANHTNWWDGFIAFQLSNNYLGADDYLMMDIEQMSKYRFFKYVGVFSVNRNDAREGIESINYAADLLKNTSRFLWIFPQGEMKPQDYEPVIFYNGIAHIAEKLGKVNLIPVSLRYEFIKEQRPEVFIKIGEPEIVSSAIGDTKQFTETLKQKLVKDLSSLKNDVINQNLGEYKIIFTGKDSRNKTVDRIADK